MGVLLPLVLLLLPLLLLSQERCWPPCLPPAGPGLPASPCPHQGNTGDNARNISKTNNPVISTWSPQGILEVAEDLAIDIPKFWTYLAEILAPVLLAAAAPVGVPTVVLILILIKSSVLAHAHAPTPQLTLLRDTGRPLPPHLSERYVANVLGTMAR